MHDQPPIGERFSLVYLRPQQLLPDTPRFRRRLIKVFEAHAGNDSADFGQHLEVALGIKVLLGGYEGLYIDWEDFLGFELRDVLDCITLLHKYLILRNANTGAYIKHVRHVLAEEAMAYRLDDEGGVHPAIDTAYQIAQQTVIRSLGTQEFHAARQYIVRADDELLPKGNTREAIRAIFDAVENVFKQCFPKAISINKANIQNYLRPHIDQLYLDNVARRTANKSIESLIDWVDAAHNYRHEPGHAEPVGPPDDLAVMIVSQGLAYVRWLADIKPDRDVA